MAAKERIVVKIGGRAAEDETALLSLAGEFAALSTTYDLVLVHGGGAAVSSIQKVYGIEPLFVDGKRITAPEEMDIVDMGLAGKMNKYLVRLFRKAGVNGVGLSGCDGALFSGKSFGDHEGRENRSGRIDQCDPALVTLLWEKNFQPILSSVSYDKDGRGININADEAALGVAEALEASSLLFISDIPGILNGENLISEMNEKDIEKALAEEVITGGMIPKVQSSLDALKKGVSAIVISDYKKSGDLSDMISNNKGTKITL
ncbi:MAG: acetylglutamate kinase [Spirochaetales bacterium]|nr:acetylglutamate kinase [Spirochaetales bacterium]